MIHINDTNINDVDHTECSWHYTGR